MVCVCAVTRAFMVFQTLCVCVLGTLSPFCDAFSWLALGPGKVAWKLVDVQGLACTIRSGLPLSVAQVIESAAWKGGPLIQLTDTITRPQADDLVLNHCWIKPFVQKFREKVPSGFFVVDTFLYLDKLYNGKLLQPLNAGDSKHSLASEEAKKVKLLIGTLRALWRSSKLVQLRILHVCWFKFIGLHRLCARVIRLRCNRSRQSWKPSAHF